MLIPGVIWSSADGEILGAGAGGDVRSSSDAILISGVLGAQLGSRTYQIWIYLKNNPVPAHLTFLNITVQGYHEERGP